MQLDDYEGRFFSLLSSSFQPNDLRSPSVSVAQICQRCYDAFLICSQAAGEERHPQNTAEPSDMLSAD